jgi:hypothetical protein
MMTRKPVQVQDHEKDKDKEEEEISLLHRARLASLMDHREFSNLPPLSS